MNPLPPSDATVRKMIRAILVPRGVMTEATWQRMRDYERRLAALGLWSYTDKCLTLEGTKYKRLLKEG
jgi:hypothetical protein